MYKGVNALKNTAQVFARLYYAKDILYEVHLFSQDTLN